MTYAKMQRWYQESSMQIAIPPFHNARLLVVGDVMLDRYWHGSASRISPEAPVPVVRITEREDRPGGAANVALNLTALGCQAQLVGVTGRDEAASVLQQRLQAAGVGSFFQQRNDQPTITKLRVVSRQQQLIRLDFEESTVSIDQAALLQQVESLLTNKSVLVLSDYQKGTLQDCQPLIRAACAHGVPVLVDPKGRNFEHYRGATLLTPNLTEFEEVMGPVTSEQDLITKGLALIERLELQALLITRSEKGMTLLRPGQPELHLPARAREVYDVTGAGDTVISVLAAALAAGSSMENAVALANVAAGLAVAKQGTATVSVPELYREVHRDANASRGVMSEDQLLLALAEARARGAKIVFTNGCFDIIHAGHVSYLDSARQQGDCLVVAVNSDTSVTKLKGPGRPINPADKRMAVLAALSSVDWVVEFGSETPEPLLQKIRPDVLVKGGDYSPDQVVGADFVRSYGGTVKVLDFVEDMSTTRIVEKIAQHLPGKPV
jgi:D-beta-D-heptose 7-phosphate kinase/D-beta-D-heptose 1-phosphate adenosyltransferase